MSRNRNRRINFMNALALLLATIGAVAPNQLVNILVSKAGREYMIDSSPASQLPHLPLGTPAMQYRQAGTDAYAGTIVVAGPLSLGPTDTYYKVSLEMRRGVQIFLDWLHTERGGVTINGSRYSMQFEWVGDGSSKLQVTNATAQALRASNAHFAWGGYSSGLTFYAAKQSAADGKLMIASNAASLSVYTQNNLTFGILPQAGKYYTSSMAAVAAAAASQGDALRWGIIQVDAVFTKAVCSPIPTLVASHGMHVAANVITVPASVNDEAYRQALRHLRENGANAIVGCTYTQSGMALVRLLEELDYSPKALLMTAAVTDTAYTSSISKGWWQGEYVVGVTPWMPTVPGRGTFSQMTSSEFADRYRQRFGGEPSYQCAAHFASGCTLVAAIEAANSLETTKVLSQLRNMSLDEHFGHIEFDEHGVTQGSMLAVQFAAGKFLAVPDVVAPQGASTGLLQYPMPTWAQRRCRAIGAGKDYLHDTLQSKGYVECSGNGLCNANGDCECNENYKGRECQDKEDDTMLKVGLGVFGAVLLLGGLGFARYRHVKIAKSRSQKQKIEKMREELQSSLVGMRCAAMDFNPQVDVQTARLPQATNVTTGVYTRDSVVIDMTGVPMSQADWYWEEDNAKVDSHASSHAGKWIPYKPATQRFIEEKFAAWSADRRSGAHIVNVPTVEKLHARNTGSAYAIDFSTMKQINLQTKHERPILRLHSSPQLQSSLDTHRPPADLGDGAVLLCLQQGSLVRVSKEREDGWAYGNMVFDPSARDQVASAVGSEQVSTNAGWFPMACTREPTQEDLAPLQHSMGGGADCLQPPAQWAVMTSSDALAVERFVLPEGLEKQQVVAAFMATLPSSIQVLDVERIQNMSMWQSYAVKRQTIISREKNSKDVASQRCERVWLFHGTNAEVIPKIIQQGFNRSFCGKNATVYGKGVYFARDASYSSSTTYSVPDQQGMQHMFACRVAIGEYCQGRSNVLTPDVREGNILYDTTVDTVENPRIFVTYHDAQAYPEYIVHFRQ